MEFEEELAKVLPEDLPNRARVIKQGAKHLNMLVELNQHLNLTRITTPREAAIKHVLDSVMPWRLFENAQHVLDAGTGAGYPGIPLAIVFPEKHFTLSESIQKKARCVQFVKEALGLMNVTVTSDRAEELLKRTKVDLITARAVAPLSRAVVLFGPALQRGIRALLYKGPDVETEIAETLMEARRRGVSLNIVSRYELPESLGSRTIVEMSKRL